MHLSIFKDMSLFKWIYNIGIMFLLIFILTYLIAWEFALLYIMGLFVHEAGHIAVAKGFDLEVTFGGFTLFGAYVNIHSEIQKKEEAMIALAGPFCSLMYSAMLLLLYPLLQYESLMQASCFIGMMNIINLLPISPLDGGKIARIIHPSIVLILIPLIVYFAYSLENVWFTMLCVYVVLHYIYNCQKDKRVSYLPKQSYSRTSLFFLYVIIYFLQILLSSYMFSYFMIFMNTIFN